MGCSPSPRRRRQGDLESLRVPLHPLGFEKIRVAEPLPPPAGLPASQNVASEKKKLGKPPQKIEINCCQELCLRCTGPVVISKGPLELATFGACPKHHLSLVGPTQVGRHPGHLGMIGAHDCMIHRTHIMADGQDIRLEG